MVLRITARAAQIDHAQAKSSGLIRSAFAGGSTDLLLKHLLFSLSGCCQGLFGSTSRYMCLYTEVLFLLFHYVYIVQT